MGEPTYLKVNPEQHKFVHLKDPRTHSNVCYGQLPSGTLCLLPRSAEIHQRYEQDAQRFRGANALTRERQLMTASEKDRLEKHLSRATSNSGPIRAWCFDVAEGLTKHLPAHNAEIKRMRARYAEEGTRIKAPDTVWRHIGYACEGNVFIAPVGTPPPSPVKKKGNDMTVTPDELRAAAAEMAAQAQKIEDFLALEPQGEEPVITWKHSFDSVASVVTGEKPQKEYTYVAVKLGKDWYLTGHQSAGRKYRWEDFRNLTFAAELVEGDFLICTEWGSAK